MTPVLISQATAIRRRTPCPAYLRPLPLTAAHTPATSNSTSSPPSPDPPHVWASSVAAAPVHTTTATSASSDRGRTRSPSPLASASSNSDRLTAPHHRPAPPSAQVGERTCIQFVSVDLRLLHLDSIDTCSSSLTSSALPGILVTISTYAVKARSECRFDDFLTELPFICFLESC
jgi:hypothetical protein